MTIQQRIEFRNVRRAPRYFRVFLHVTIFAIAHLACGSDAPSTPPFTRHDSAGIAVIENHTPAWSDVNAGAVVNPSRVILRRACRAQSGRQPQQ